MGNAVTTTKDFQERMFERIRDQIGDLLTEEDLKKLVDAAVQKAFFEKRTVVIGDGWSRREAQVDPYFVELLREEMKERVKAEVATWLAEHPAEIVTAIERTIGGGILACLVREIELRTQGPVNSLVSELTKKGVLG